MPPHHVIIAGGGLAGPALAIALARQSVRSTILERHASVQDIGGVIMLAPNAMCVLDHTVGIADKLQTLGSPFDAINIFLEKGDVLNQVGGFGLHHNGRSAMSIARPVLHQTLMDECERLKDKIDIRFSAKLQSIKESESGVEAIMEDGSRVEGDILIGADGIGSKVRQHVLGKTIAPTYSGIMMVGCILPRANIIMPETMKFPAFCYTRLGAFLSFAMDDNRLQWVTSLETPEKERKNGWNEYRTSGQAVADLKAKYKDVKEEPIRSMVDALNNDNVRIWAPYLMPELETWHTDRVCMVGDAAHAIPPSAGQGAAQAFEDVGLMARLLLRDEKPDYPTLFEQFETLRRPRIAKIRDMTKRAENTRRETTSGLAWLVKTWIAKAAFWYAGDKKGNMNNSDVPGYDVTSVPI